MRRRRFTLALAIVVMMGAANAAAQGQPRLATPPVRAPAATVTETEPNDTTTTANLVSLGDTVSGAIDPGFDVDVFAVDLTAGSTVDIDVDADALGSPLYPWVHLLDPNGNCCLAENTMPNARVVYPITVDGRYFVTIQDLYGRWGPEHTYQMTVRETVLDELEPNDAPALATVIGLGDTATAILSPPSDVDYFAVDVPGETRLNVWLNPMAYFNGVTTLYDVDGTTVLGVDTVDSGRPGAWVHILTAGRYYVRVHDYSPQGSQGHAYALAINSMPLGPGDTLTVVASGQGNPGPITAGATGELYVYDHDADRLLRVGATGTVTELWRHIDIGDMVVDGVGDLLAIGRDHQTGAVAVWRFTPTGSRSVFTSGDYGALTIGPDGDVWAAGCTTPDHETLSRYDPVGRLKSTTSLAPCPPVRAMAFSPDGTLHVATPTGVARLSGSTLQRVIAVDGVQALAFDRDGRLYALRSYQTVLRYDQTYRLMEDHFAWTDMFLTDLAFARNASGGMTARLLLSVFWKGGLSEPAEFRIYQANAAGVEAPGFRIGTDLLRITGVPPDTLLMGAQYSGGLAATNAPAAVTWRLDDGALPPGLALDSTSGVLSGTPQEPGDFTAIVRATSGTMVGYRSIGISVVAPAVAVQDAVNRLLGAQGALTSYEETYLDLQGNHNGGFDIGDLRALLRDRGLLSAPPAAARDPEGSAEP